MNAEEAFQRAIGDTAAVFKTLAKSEVLLFHHNDADGISSGAILAHAFERNGLRVRRFCLEKPYPEVLQTIIQDPDNTAESVLVFTDFASGMLPQLLDINRRKLPLFVIDHHTVAPAAHPCLHLLNCTTFGISSDPNCSASAIALLFAVALEAANEDLAALGVLGAVGDGLFDSSGKLCGINAVAAELAVKNGSLKLVDGEYYLSRPDWIPARELANQVNSLGGFGYFRGGSDIAVKGLRDGCSAAFTKAAQSIRAEFDAALDVFVRGRFMISGRSMQYFVLGAEFAGFGVKTVGLVCEELIARGLVDESKYLAGFQVIPDEIPGLGKFEFRQSKVSMRLPKCIKNDVQAHQKPSLAIVLPEATRAVHGFVDACHPHAAATTIRRGDEQKLIEALEKAIARAGAA